MLNFFRSKKPDKPAVQPPPLVATAAVLPPPAKVFDKEDLMERLMGNEALAQRVVGLIVEALPLELACLSIAVNAEDMESTQKMAHALKGSAANTSGPALAEAAARLETVARAQNIVEARKVFAELTAESDRALNAFTQFLAT